MLKSFKVYIFAQIFLKPNSPPLGYPILGLQDEPTTEGKKKNTSNELTEFFGKVGIVLSQPLQR